MGWWIALATLIISMLIEVRWTIQAAKERRLIGIAGLIVSFYLLTLLTFYLWYAGALHNGTLTIVGSIVLILLHIADVIVRPKK